MASVPLHTRLSPCTKFNIGLAVVLVSFVALLLAVLQALLLTSTFIVTGPVYVANQFTLPVAASMVPAVAGLIVHNWLSALLATTLSWLSPWLQ